ncbi:MAG: hypothetical protein ABH840_02895 [Nanoarchaeota archaeon]
MKKEVVIVLIVILLFLIGVWQFKSLKSFSTPDPDSEEKECVKDEDCVPVSCCHASSCVAGSEKPDCSDIFCTQSCEPGTLDCGQGSCKCLKNKCSAVLK